MAQVERKEGPASHKYRKRRLCELAVDEVVGICHAFIVENRFRKDIAEQYRVSVDLVSRVVRQCKSNEHFVGELKAKEQLKAKQVDDVERSVAQLLSDHGCITSTQ